MVDNTSVFKISGLPEPLGYAIAIFLFILLLSPYFSGGDFGIFKIPTFTDDAKRWLKVVGPILFSVCILSFLPIIPANAEREALCPEIAGSWQRQVPPDKLLFKIEQSDCNITSNTEWHMETKQIKQQLSGRYIKSEGYFDLTVDHTEEDKSSSGGKYEEKMYGRLYVMPGNQIKSYFYASAGSCSHMGGASGESWWSRL